MPVLEVTGRIRTLIADMIETMYAAGGVGLAAPQVFDNRRILIYDVGQGAQALVNPEILSAEGSEVDVEGCLSIPRLHGKVDRHTQLTVSGLNEKGRRVRLLVRDPYLARVLQHEIDHLNGVLFIDRAEKDSLYMISEEAEAERRARAHAMRQQQGEASTV